MTGVECPSVVQTSIGTVLPVQWRFTWYPLQTARKRAQHGEQLVIPSRHASSLQPSVGRAGRALAVQRLRAHPLLGREGEERLLLGAMNDPDTPEFTNTAFALQRYTLAGNLDAQFGSCTSPTTRSSSP
jgi:hypothetical protein